jgi:hypothetical protein
MSHHEALAAAAHLHVMLRRKTGRVTDTEWMASNVEYARAIVAFAREKAVGSGHTDLVPLADRMEALMAQSGAGGPPSQGHAAAQRTEPAALFSTGLAGPGTPPEMQNSRYIGRLR